MSKLKIIVRFLRDAQKRKIALNLFPHKLTNNKKEIAALTSGSYFRILYLQVVKAESFIFKIIHLTSYSPGLHDCRDVSLDNDLE